MKTRRRHRPHRVAAAVGIVALALVACGGGSSSEPAATTPTTEPSTTAAPAAATTPTTPPSTTIDLSSVSLKVGFLSFASAANTAIRDESGAFANATYSLDWVEFESSSATLEALNGGAIDVAVDLQATGAVIAQGNAKTPWTSDTAPFAVLSASVPGPEAGVTILVRADSDIQSVADLAGKKVTFVRGSVGQYFWVLAAADAGIDPEAAEQVLLAPAEGRVAFVSGAVDAFVTVSVNAPALVRDAGARVLIESDERVQQPRLVQVRQGLLDDPVVEAAIGDLIERLDARNQWVVDHHDEAVAIYETTQQLSNEDATRRVDEWAANRVPLDLIVPGLQDQADVFFEAGVSASEVDVTVIMDRRFEGSIGS